jgi:DNA polymerase-3 subunit epsilon
MYLFFDTETTGLPRSWNAPVTDVNNWPRMVQIAWQVHDATGKLVEEASYIIKPEAFTISKEVSKVHGITNERAILEGTPLEEVLTKFKEQIDKAGVIVAHNLSFDEKIVGAEFLRKGLANAIPPIKKRICTMQKSTDYCKIPSPKGYKFPKLEELHQKLFNTGFAEMHNAAADIKATAKCFFELQKRGVV